LWPEPNGEGYSLKPTAESPRSVTADGVHRHHLAGDPIPLTADSHRPSTSGDRSAARAPVEPIALLAAGATVVAALVEAEASAPSVALPAVACRLAHLHAVRHQAAPPQVDQPEVESAPRVASPFQMERRRTVVASPERPAAPAPAGSMDARTAGALNTRGF